MTEPTPRPTPRSQSEHLGLPAAAATAVVGKPTVIMPEVPKLSFRKLARVSVISSKWMTRWDRVKQDTGEEPSSQNGVLDDSTVTGQGQEALLLEGIQAEALRKESEVCRMEDSPYYVHRVAAAGRVDELDQLLRADAGKVRARDNRQWTCLHHAAKKSRLAVIDLLVEFAADLEARDNEGRTPLHIAIINDKAEAVRHLLVLGADGNAKFNAQRMGALHLAAQHDRALCIDVMAEFKDERVNMNDLTECGATALHIAANVNAAGAAEALLRGGTKLCVACNNGFYAIHNASKSASTGVLEVMLVYGEKLGYSREHMLGFCDLDSNAPLHAAVNSGDIQVVRILLEAGARVDCRQAGQSTAFHLACSQGTFELVRLMYEAQEQMCDDHNCTNELLSMVDVLGMTPLHRAAMFDHANVVQYLIERGANVDAVDNEHRTALMLAALRCGSTTMRLLYEAKADVTIKDRYERNLLHYIVNYSAAPLTNELSLICQTELGRKLLNERDSETGCTPLHIASKRGQLAFLDRLLLLGAALNTKNYESQSPLHFAARYGRAGTVRRILETPQGACVINETDHKGMTALHIASLNGHEKVVQLLLNKGALVHRDFEGCTPLHLAARSGYTQTMKLLLAFHNNLLDLKDKRGNTALHAAALTNKANACAFLLDSSAAYSTNNDGYTPLDCCIEQRHIEAASKMLEQKRWREIVSADSGPFTCPLLGLIKNLPEVQKIVLDQCYTQSHLDPSSKDYWEKYDFSFLQADLEKVEAAKKQGKSIEPLLALNMMVKYGRVDLLSHPVSLKYLVMKWRAYGAAVNFVKMLFYVLYIACLTSVIACFDPRFMRVHNRITRIVPLNRTSMLTATYGGYQSHHLYDPELDVPTWKWPTQENWHEANLLYCVPLFILMTLLTGNIVKECVQIYMQRLGYLFELVNYSEWLLYISSAMYVYPIVLYGRICDVQWRCAAIAVFLAWFNLLIYLQRWDSVGIYVVMFLEIMKTVFRVTAIFSVLFVAFGLTFYILLASSRPLEPLHTPLLSVIETVTMMLGELRFSQLYSRPHLYKQLLYPGLNFSFMALFILLVPVLFINLLIGLAVGDIEMVQKNAKLRRLAMQVEYHTELEERWLPVWLLRRIDRQEWTVYPNCVYRGGVCSAVCKRMRDLATSGVMHLTIATQAQQRKDTELYSGQLHSDVDKCKRRMRDMQLQLTRQTELLRLIVQKMDISEQNEFDEGDSSSEWGSCNLVSARHQLEQH